MHCLLVSLLLTEIKYFTPFSSVSIFDFEQKKSLLGKSTNSDSHQENA